MPCQDVFARVIRCPLASAPQQTSDFAPSDFPKLSSGVVQLSTSLV